MACMRYMAEWVASDERARQADDFHPDMLDYGRAELPTRAEARDYAIARDLFGGDCACVDVEELRGHVDPEWGPYSDWEQVERDVCLDPQSGHWETDRVD